MQGRSKWEKKKGKENKNKKKRMVLGLDGFRVSESPILFFVVFHKVLGLELGELQSVCVGLLQHGKPEISQVLDLVRRYRFLRIVHEHHCAAEDMVIFRALDSRVNNIACTYSLEHRSIDELFNSVLNCLNTLLEDDGNSSEPLQELALCSRTIRTSICQHMLKEEEQVFPLLMQRFSFREQASLVWEFMFSVPIMLLEDFMSWLASYLSNDELVDVSHCIQEVIPITEKLLQEVVISWLFTKKPASVYGVEYPAERKASPSSKKEPHPEICSTNHDFLGVKCHEGESQVIPGTTATKLSVHPLDGFLTLWHGAIRKELKEILDELDELRNFRVFPTLSSVSGQIMFLANVLVVYSEVLDKVIFPGLDEHITGPLTLSPQKFPLLKQFCIEDILHVLWNLDVQNGKSLCELLDKLFYMLEFLLEEINRHFTIQESEVSPLICKHCDLALQQNLLYQSLRMMPIGLLKYAITWFSAHLTEEESKAFLGSINLAGPAIDSALALLLNEWVCDGNTGKISLETLRKMLENRRCLNSENIEEGATFSCLKLGGDYEISHSSQARDSSKCSTSYSSGMSLHIFFPRALKQPSPFPRFLGCSKSGASPIDHIFQFHRALEHDLEYLDVESAKLADNYEIFPEFRRRFHLTRCLFQAHSDAEDEILFPALEAKGTFCNISHSYSIDHKLEDEHFNDVSISLDDISELYASLLSFYSGSEVSVLSEDHLSKYRELCLMLHGMCKSMRTTLCHHVHREELELWPLFLQHFSEDEQEKIIGHIIGRTRAEILQAMIPWLMTSLTPEELSSMIDFWLKVTKNTMFRDWLREWSGGSKKDDISFVTGEQDNPSPGTTDASVILARHLSKEDSEDPVATDEQRPRFLESNLQPVNVNKGNQSLILRRNPDKGFKSLASSENAKETLVDTIGRAEKPGELREVAQKFNNHEEGLFTMNQEELEASIRKVSRDTALDPHKKSYLIQNLLMSPWIVSQQKLSRQEELLNAENGEELPGHCASYRDSSKFSFGCAHYKRNCKLLASCCNRLFTCRFCHDDASNHSMDRKSTTKMMCMKCLNVQPIGPRCMDASCNGLSMAKYFCNLCKLFDDEREIYHCPFCNLCRVGKGLGIDYFHCMNCNACMSKALSVHICREKCFESNCPICHDDIFTSSLPVKALSCGHLMHSTCFQDYTCTRYTCPICSKSLGDMRMYFAMLDALLAEENVPEEFCGQNQEILCNDCEKRGVAPFHWLYHKCSYCGSYNTRLL